MLWSVAWQPKDKGAPSCDDYVVVEHPDQVVLALVDGSCNGARDAAAAWLQRGPGAATVAQIIHRFAGPGDDSTAPSFEIMAKPQ